MRANLTWTGTQGPDAGRSETDPYELAIVGENVFLVRWQEKDGTIVHSLLDLQQNTVATSILPLPFLKGKITAIPRISMARRDPYDCLERCRTRHGSGGAYFQCVAACK